MKKCLIFLLCLGIGLLCLGCDFGTPVPSDIPTEPPVVETQPPQTDCSLLPQPQYDIPFLAVSAPAVSMTFENDAGETVLRYTCQNLELTLPDPQIAGSIMVDYLNLVDYESGTVAKLLDDAVRASLEDSGFQCYDVSILYSPQRLDSEILSLYGTQIIDKGGIRPSVNCLASTYDMITGRKLSLQDVLVKDYSADTLASRIVDALAERSAEGILYSDYAYVISQMFSTNTPVTTWYFSSSGLCFYFAPYEIAPYSAGTVVAEIPYESLTGLLKDDYFPGELEILTGTVVASPFQDGQTSSIQQFSEVILDGTAAEYLLSAEGGVRNVRIETGTWNSDGSFTPQYTVFASAALTNVDGIMLQAADIASLRISYETEAGTVVLPMSQLIS